jgi:hypothetical protein
MIDIIRNILAWNPSRGTLAPLLAFAVIWQMHHQPAAALQPGPIPPYATHEADRLNDACQGSGRDCHARDVAFRRLAREGWCFWYGERSAADAAWHHCQLGDLEVLP